MPTVILVVKSLKTVYNLKGIACQMVLSEGMNFCLISAQPGPSSAPVRVE